MKITKKYIQNLIKEEIKRLLEAPPDDPRNPDASDELSSLRRNYIIAINGLKAAAGSHKNCPARRSAAHTLQKLGHAGRLDKGEEDIHSVPYLKHTGKLP